ncbi:MAG TPA: hypothetical protein VK453_11850 [Micromonosporaceae bacterium]|nr:hypothetical protein [Micromonosporaceae bacterium]
MTIISPGVDLSVPTRPRSDADFLDAICAVLNSTDSGADAYQEIAQLVMDAGRPYVDDLPVVESHANPTAHGLPRTHVLVDGEDAVVLWVDEGGAIQVWVNTRGGRPMRITVDGSVIAGDAEPVAAER